MALAENVIIFNYRQAISKADELDAAATKIEADAVGEMDAIISAVNQNWTGDSAEEYINKCSTEQIKIGNIAGNIRETAQTIRSMAETIKAAEMEALRIAEAAAAAVAAVVKK